MILMMMYYFKEGKLASIFTLSYSSPDREEGYGYFVIDFDFQKEQNSKIGTMFISYLSLQNLTKRNFLIYSVLNIKAC